jgi:hypothetical protein
MSSCLTVLRGIDRVWTGFFRRGRYFRLMACSLKNPRAGCRFDAHLQRVPNGDVCCVTQISVDDDEKPIPPFSDVAVEPDTVHTPNHKPSMPAAFQANGFHRPLFFGIERNNDNRDAFVTFDQFSFELDPVHMLSIPCALISLLFGVIPLLIYD